MFFRALGVPVAMASLTSCQHLVATPMARFGAEVSGCCLRSALAGRPAAFAQQLQPLLDRHGLLLFRRQQPLQPTDHLRLAECLGTVFPLPTRFQHARAPHRDILRMSNSDAEGFTGVGTSGWHVDGVSYECPFGYALMRIVEVPSRGPTRFMPLHRLAESLRQSRPSGTRLSARCGSENVRWHQPLLYAHPRTQRLGVCLGKVSRLVSELGGADERVLEEEEAAAVLEELAAHVAAHAVERAYDHAWEEGDVVVVDNLAVAHLAPPETQLPPEEIGLRVLHRVVTAGEAPLGRVPDDDGTRCLGMEPGAQ